jgi:hypothetical protein
MFGATGGARKPVGIILGLIFMAFGILPLLKTYNIISFSLPGFPQLVLWVLGVVGGILMLYDAIKEGQEMHKKLMIPTLVLALILLAFSIVPILNMFNVVSFALPVLGATIIEVLFALSGLLLIIGAFAVL